jgi:hypothetical protein
MFLRTVLIAASVVLSVQASAEPDASDNEEYLANESLASCVKRWDARNHMTRGSWRETCQRISDERAGFLREQQVVPDRK